MDNTACVHDNVPEMPAERASARFSSSTKMVSGT